MEAWADFAGHPNPEPFCSSWIRGFRALQSDVGYGDARGHDSEDAHDDAKVAPKRARTLKGHAAQGAQQGCPIRGPGDELSHCATRTTVARGPSSTANLLCSGYAAPTDSGMEPLDDAAVSLGVVVSGADAILGCRSFAMALVHVVRLPAHKYGVADRQESPLDWDRKSWSHLDAFTDLGVPVDPGNVVLARCTQASQNWTCPWTLAA